MIIYFVRNRFDSRVYIGQTFRTLEVRRKEHFCDVQRSSDLYFHRALRKHGPDAFEWSVIDWATSKSELNIEEVWWIAFYDSTISQRGYNLTFGGEGGIPTKETRKKLSEQRKGPKNSMYGRHCFGEDNPFYGKHHSVLTKNAIRQKVLQRVDSIETRKKKSMSARGNHNAQENHFSHTDEEKEKMRRACVGRKGPVLSGNENGMFGKHHSEETRRRMSLSHLRRILE